MYHQWRHDSYAVASFDTLAEAALSIRECKDAAFKRHQKKVVKTEIALHA
jgi:hypothetical protein